MKYIVLIFWISLFPIKSLAQIKEDKFEEVSTKNIERTLKYLASDDLRGRNLHSEGLKKAAVYLIEELQKYGIKPYFNSYRDTISNLDDLWNIVALIPGTDKELKNEFVVLGAHYDHIGVLKQVDGDSIANGANDNATGVSVLLELARSLNKNNLRRSTLICFFTAEEIGLIGSEHLANRLNKDNLNISLMINFEMLGLPMNEEFMGFLTGYNRSNLGEVINTIAEEELVGEWIAAENQDLFSRSDNYPFFKVFSVPSQTISTFDPSRFNYYHHVKDEVHLMDLEFMTSLTNKLLPVVKKLINFPPGEIRLK